jgi:hypothetical protein
MTGPRNSDFNFLLAELRRMSARARLALTEIDSIGAALKGGLIEPEAALAWLDEIDPALLDLIGTPMEISAT